MIIGNLIDFEKKEDQVIEIKTNFKSIDDVFTKLLLKSSEMNFCLCFCIDTLELNASYKGFIKCNERVYDIKNVFQVSSLKMLISKLIELSSFINVSNN